MRHVDDTHDPERDGEPDGGEQQHRAEREPVPGILHQVPHGEPGIDRADRICGGAFHLIRAIRRKSRQQAACVLIAALANDRHGVELIGDRRVREVEDDRGARLSQGAFDPDIGFLGNRRVQCLEGVGIACLEHRLRGVVALGRIRGQQRQRTHGSVDRAPEPVVQTNRLQTHRRSANHGPAGGGIHYLPGFLPDVDLLVIRVEQQAPVLHGFDHLRGQRIAACRNRIDRRLGVAEGILGETRKCRVIALRARQPAGQQQSEDDDERRQAIVDHAHHHNKIPAFGKGGGGAERRPRVHGVSCRTCWSWC